MPKRSRSMWARGRRKGAKLSSSSPQPSPQGTAPGAKKAPMSKDAMLKSCVTQTSQLAMHVQQLLDGPFAVAPTQLRGYLNRADSEIRDLLRLLTSKIGGTPDADVLEVSYFDEDTEQPPQGTTLPQQQATSSDDEIRRGTGKLVEMLATADTDMFDHEIEALSGFMLDMPQTKKTSKRRNAGA